MFKKIFKNLIFLSLLTLTIPAFADFENIPGDFRVVIKCTEVNPTSDHRAFRYNARIYRNNSGKLILSVHKVNNGNNSGSPLVEELVTSQRVSTNPDATEFWNADNSLILKDVRPYHGNASILDYRALPKSYFLKCFHVPGT